MAIGKEKTLNNGAVGDYWKITIETYDKQSRLCTWYISLFTSKAHSDAKAPSLGMTKIFSKIATLEELQGNRTLLGYTHIRAKAEEMVSYDISGNPITPRQFDEDLADGDVV